MSRQVQRCAELCHEHTKKNQKKPCHLFQFASNCDPSYQGYLGRRCVGFEKCDARGCGWSSGEKCEKHMSKCKKQIRRIMGKEYQDERSWPKPKEPIKPCPTGCILLRFRRPKRRSAGEYDCDKVAWYDACVRGKLILFAK